MKSFKGEPIKAYAKHGVWERWNPNVRLWERRQMRASKEMFEF